MCAQVPDRCGQGPAAALARQPARAESSRARAGASRVCNNPAAGEAEECAGTMLGVSGSGGAERAGGHGLRRTGAATHAQSVGLQNHGFLACTGLQSFSQGPCDRACSNSEFEVFFSMETIAVLQ
eukprot:scaffold82375_cov15-Tisochrysis_lutea.AAC.1